MVIVYIKKDRFFKNVNPYGEIFEIEYPTRNILLENKETIAETYDNYIENGYIKIELADIYKDCIYQDFNEDLTFNVEKYNARKEKEKAVDYENKIVALIRERYNVNQELAILRQKDTKTEEYQAYYDYVEECKAKVKQEM